MSGSQASSSSGTTYTVRLPRKTNKKHMLMKFNPSNKVDFAKAGSVQIERENNLRQYKISHNIDQDPKFGAGSEFGREQKDEARRKKLGIQMKSYNPDAQPWLLKLGNGKTTRKFKGSKEGGILDNASYYIFTQCTDGAFEAHLVDEWYNFIPAINYKYLNSDEAEEEFSRRDKTINYFSIMVKKRLKNDAADDDEDEKKGKSSSKSKKRSSFKLTEMEDWDSDDSQGDDEDSDTEDKDKESKAKRRTKKKAGREKSRKVGNKVNSDNEAVEESDSMDEGQEVDYITDSDSDDEGMYDDTAQEKTDKKYNHKGVEDEDDLRKMISSGEESEEENKEENPEENEKNKDGSGSDSLSSSGSDSDPEDTTDFTSAVFMQKSKKSGDSESGSRPSSRPGTPSELGKKRKAGSRRDSPAPKKSRSNSPVPVTGSTTVTTGTSSLPTSPLATGQLATASSTTAAAASAGDGISEEAVRRYLERKPMTTTDLLLRFKNKNPTMPKDKLVDKIASILKKMNLKQEKIKDKLYLSLNTK